MALQTMKTKDSNKKHKNKNFSKLSLGNIADKNSNKNNNNGHLSARENKYSKKIIKCKSDDN